MQQEGQQYSCQFEKLMISQVASTQWAHSMDLLALTTYDHLIELYRISYKAQRVFQNQENHPVHSLAFSPDQHLLTYGMEDGSIRMVRTQNGQHVLVVEGGDGPVESLSFVKYTRLQCEEFLPFQKGSMEGRLILNISPHKNCNKNAIIKINYFREMTQQYSLLLASTPTKTTLLLNGFIPIAHLTYSHLALSRPKLHHCHYDGVIYSIVGEEGGERSTLWCVKHEAAVLQQSAQTIIRFNCLLEYVLQILCFVETAYNQVELTLRDILRQYNSKINLIDDSNVQDINPCDQLFRFLNCGTTSNAIINFFTKEVYDTKILQKLDQTLNQCFTQLHDLLLESIQNSLERATLIIKKLLCFSEVGEVGGLGLRREELQRAEGRVVRLYTMGEVLLVESTEAKFDIRNLLVWLNKATIKSAGENEVEIQNNKSYLNKYTVDFSRLHKFVGDQQRFKLRNLMGFFNKTNARYSPRIPAPEFTILANPSRPHQTPEQQANLAHLSRLLEVEDIPSAPQKIEVEESYESFKGEMTELMSLWRGLSLQPQSTISARLQTKWSKTKIGELSHSTVFGSEVRTIVVGGEWWVYFVERQEGCDRLVKYNCHSGERGSVVCREWHILQVGVAEEVLGVLEERRSGRKLVVGVENERWEGEELEMGRRISRIEGELDVNCSMRGLNSLIVDKNKMIIFD